MSDFGPMLTTGEVERRVEAHLKDWMDTATRAVERIEGLDARVLADIETWDRTSTLDDPNAIVTPAVLIVCGGTVRPPVRDGEGKYRATYGVEVGVIASSLSASMTRDLASRLGHAVLIAMTRPGIDGRHGPVVWTGMQTDDVPIEDSRTLASFVSTFDIEFENVLSTMDGPLSPLSYEDAPDVPPDDPTVSSVEVSVTKD